jgi:hypothetical protein
MVTAHAARHSGHFGTASDIIAAHTVIAPRRNRLFKGRDCGLTAAPATVQHDFIATILGANNYM